MIIDVQKAAEILRSEDVVALPTETVYGLAADASSIIALKKVFDLKQRPADNPLIVHVAGISQAHTLAETGTNDFLLLANEFWPGPLTLVLPKKPGVLDIITAGLETVAIRMPDHPKTLAVIEKSGPVAAPSANRSGKPSPTRPEHVLDDFGDDLPVVDGGTCSVGLESTVLDLSGSTPAILRPGKITADEIEEIIGKKVSAEAAGNDQRRRSPGTRYSHYKPSASVNWMSPTSSQTHRPGTLYIYHTHTPTDTGNNVILFEGDYLEFAKSLYDLYRTADKKKYKYILIEPLPDATLSPIIPALLNRIQRSVSN